jgi:alkylation response protein AidB-like acyl-CoA dehydrogenase
MRKKMVKFMTQVINDEILEKLSLENRYTFVNNNLMSVLSPQAFNFLKKIQKFCLKLEKNNNISHGPNEEIYNWIPEAGKAGVICRLYKFENIDLNYEPYGMMADFMRCIAGTMFDPQFALVIGASQLAINPIHLHHENFPVRLEALKDLVIGKHTGCILITEPERGSDAINQLTTCEAKDDGSYIINGEKLYNTNAPKAKWAVMYATAQKNNGNMMAQFLVDTSWEGWNCERIFIPWIPKVHLGFEKLINLRVPKDYVLADPGKGRDHLFEGLVEERIAVAYMSICLCWGALSHAFIYANMRKQFNQEILKFQGVGFLLTDLWAKTTNLTLSLIKFCESYDEKIEKFKDGIPMNIRRAMVVSASQLKYHCANLSEEICYESANLMGGAGLCDNTLMHDFLGVSRIQELVGGSRQIQQYIMSFGLRQLYKMI